MASERRPFLAGFSYRHVQLEDAEGWKVEGLVLGQGAGALEVVVCAADKEPNVAAVRDAWRKRQHKRNVPLLLVVLYDGKAAVCGAGGQDPPVYLGVDRDVAERVCAAALRRPSRHAAFRFLYSVLPQIDTALPGVHNQGFLTLYELRHGVPNRRDFPEAGRRIAPALHLPGRELLEALDFGLEPLDDYTYVLRSGPQQSAVALVLLEDEAPDLASDRFAHQSPVSRALSIAECHQVPYVLLVMDRALRLHPVKDGVGVAQRGRAETFVEINLDLLPEDMAGYLWLLFSAPALAPAGTFEQILQRARDHATAVGERLRERV